MRLIVRLCLPFANHTTQAIDLSSNEKDIRDLKRKIMDKFRLTSTKFYLKFQKDGYAIRMTESFTIDQFEISEKTIIFVEPIESTEELGVQENNRITTKYLGRLGILTTINEEEYKKNENNNNNNNNSPFLRNLSRSNSNFSSKNSLSDYDERESGSTLDKLFNINTYIDSELERLLKETKNKDLEAICKILTSVPETGVCESIINEIILRKKNFINELGRGGWNAFHFAVFFGHNTLVREFITKWNIDINKKTHEGWTPLLLAINKNNFEIFQLLLKQENLRINEVTPKGAALHLACRHGKNYVAALLNKNADPLLKNEESLTPLEVCTNEEILSIIEEKIKENSKNASPKSADLSSYAIIPNKPQIVIGWLYKTGPLIFNIKKRFFVLDPYDGTFIRYKEKEDYPLKPRAVIPLKDIIEVKRIENSWMMKKNLYYFEMVFSSRKIYACKYQSTSQEWVTFIYKAAAYSRTMEDQLKKNSYNLKVIATISSNAIERPAEFFELKDEQRPEDHEKLPKKSDNKDQSPKSNIENESKPKIIKQISPPNTPDKKISEKTNILKKEPSFSKNKIGFKDFQVIRILGAGAFGKVYLVHKKENNKVYAMKALKKRDLIIKKQLRYAVTEANVLKKCGHPFILTLHYSFQTPQFVYMILDYCSKGDLSLYLAQRITLSEDEARFFIAEILLAVEYLHTLDVLYRDLKPENILIGPDGHVKVADFGLAKEKVGDNNTTKSFCGSPAYLAPEMLKNKGTGKAADIYGLGAVLFEMITGTPPFYSDDIPKLYKNIQEGKLEFPSTMSEEACDLLTKLLDRNPKTRIGVVDKNEIKSHPFF